MCKPFSKINIQRAELLRNLEAPEKTVTSLFSEVVRLKVLLRIEEVIEKIIGSLSKEEAPVLVLKCRSRSNVSCLKIVTNFCSQSMAFEASTLTVPSMLWLGLLPSDIKSIGVPQDSLLPLTEADKRKLNQIKERPYFSCHPEWEREVELMMRWKQKAEIQSLVSIAPHFLTRVYLHNKLSYEDWISATVKNTAAHLFSL
ncbi:Meiotic recombination protein SPO11 [Bagarius yarrelli]|uniref:Meiotic recombination protein SPO11 n=1 Tax=Bagarius yarrelli TaxID=175774 RepID=A0A556VBU4_BAGYA|nr:Meiotic recombination protein SPO11 [Bagarius yarrelli]